MYKHMVYVFTQFCIPAHAHKTYTYKHKQVGTLTPRPESWFLDMSWACLNLQWIWTCKIVAPSPPPPPHPVDTLISYAMLKILMLLRFCSLNCPLKSYLQPLLTFINILELI